MGHPPRIPVWLRWEQSVTYFVTICVANRKPVLANKEALKAFSVAASKLQDWRVLAAMLMPDHLHVVVAPAKDHDAKLGNFSAALKTVDARRIECILEMATGLFRPLVAV